MLEGARREFRAKTLAVGVEFWIVLQVPVTHRRGNPGENLTRYHGVFAPNHRARAQIVPSRRGRDAWGECQGGKEDGAVSPHVSMGWAKRLKRVFGIEIERCDRCGGTVKIIASIEDPEVIAAILEHVGFHEWQTGIRRSPPARGPPGADSDSLPWS